MVTTDEEMTKSNDKVTEKHDFSPAVIKSINRIIQNEEYLTHSVNKRNISTGGGNYLSQLYEVDIKGKTGDSKKETNLFVKVIPDGDNALMDFQKIFRKEIFIYTDLARSFTELQDEAKIPVEERYTFAKCYNAIIDSDALILENMSKRGFKTYHRMDIMPLKVMELSIRHLAKFHGLSIVLKIKKAQFLESEKLIHSFAKNDITVGFIKDMWNLNMNYIEKGKKKNVEEFLPVCLNRYFKYYFNNEHKFRCLCHGDYRMNNILVKEVEGEIKRLIPIDYQFVYNGTPVIDLIYFIFMSTDQQFTNNHLYIIKDIYYDSLTKFLQYFDLELESIYPKVDFENDFKERLDYGLMATLIVLPLLYAEEDDVPELGDRMQQFRLDEKFKVRLNGTIDEFIQWGYI